MLLFSVGRLIVVSDQAYYRRVICEFDYDVGAGCGFKVVCVQGVQEWAENAALRSTSIEDQRRCGNVTHSDHLTSAWQESPGSSCTKINLGLESGVL